MAAKLKVWTIEEIQEMPVVGNFCGDSKLWDLISSIVMNEEYSMDTRIVALAKIDEVTGEVDGPYTESSVHDFVLEMESLFG